MEENEKSENSDKGMQKVEVVENENDNHKEEKSQKSESNKTYLNLGCCKINVGLVFTYIYIFTGALLNVINRIIFYNYNFRY